MSYCRCMTIHDRACLVTWRHWPHDPMWPTVRVSREWGASDDTVSLRSIQGCLLCRPDGVFQLGQVFLLLSTRTHKCNFLKFWMAFTSNEFVPWCQYCHCKQCHLQMNLCRNVGYLYVITLCIWMYHELLRLFTGVSDSVISSDILWISVFEHHLPQWIYKSTQTEHFHKSKQYMQIRWKWGSCRKIQSMTGNVAVQ